MQNTSGDAFWTMRAYTHYLHHSREHYFCKHYIWCGQTKHGWSTPNGAYRWHGGLKLTYSLTPWGTTRKSQRHKGDLGHNCYFYQVPNWGNIIFLVALMKRLFFNNDTIVTLIIFKSLIKLKWAFKNYIFAVFLLFASNIFINEIMKWDNTLETIS